MSHLLTNQISITLFFAESYMKGHNKFVDRMATEAYMSGGASGPGEQVVFPHPFYFTTANALMAAGHNHTIFTLTPTIICHRVLFGTR